MSTELETRKKDESSSSSSSEYTCTHCGKSYVMQLTTIQGKFKKRRHSPMRRQLPSNLTSTTTTTTVNRNSKSHCRRQSRAVMMCRRHPIAAHLSRRCLPTFRHGQRRNTPLQSWQHRWRLKSCVALKTKHAMLYVLELRENCRLE
jgi:hypothetical protein